MNDVAATLRAKVLAIEELMRELPQVELTAKHHFAHKVYGRELPIPKGTTATGKIHKYSQLNVLVSGRLLVMTEAGVVDARPPFVIVSPPGTKRIVHAMEDSIWLTVHGTSETDLGVIEATFIAQTEHEYLQFCEQQKQLTGDGT